ncbi:unnamed protein product [Oppiella nova]|uniref:non-specific serine/threonine protein kinase n=1 Tax=Oppiella nova TaxID=334625 RepID=A0A7R9MU33_9ACAR|nr:unnamed protein product [Oppiella nova]CAG2183656.1 unnamed protein product [Oppiella nova]
MIDRYRGVLRLIDWGLADFYVTDKIYPVTVASRFYKPPELLLAYHKYDFALDMWSFGCVAAALIFKREPFFNGLDNLDQLKKIVSVLGNDCLKQYVLKYQLKPTAQYLMEGIIQRRQWREFLSPTQTSLVNDITLDLIDKLLVFDHKFRLTADEALRHPFFSMKTEKMG